MMRGRVGIQTVQKTQILADCRPSIVCKVARKFGHIARLPRQDIKDLRVGRMVEEGNQQDRASTV